MEKNMNNWQTVKLFEDKISLVLPEGWNCPSIEVLEQKFPYDSKPQEVYMDEDRDRVFTCNILEKTLREDQVYAAINEIQRLIGHMYPESIRNKPRTLATKAGMAGWFSYMTGGIKEDKCHIMFVMSLERKMFFGSYHFTADNEVEEQRVFLQILKQVELLHEEEEDVRYGKGRI